MPTIPYNEISRRRDGGAGRVARGALPDVSAKLQALRFRGNVARSKWRTEMDNATLFNCCTGGVAPDWSRYSSLEISGCINDAEEGAEETYIVGGISRDKAEFFSIYGRMAEGEAEAITDCVTFAEAQAVADCLAKLARLPVETIC